MEKKKATKLEGGGGGCGGNGDEGEKEVVRWWCNGGSGAYKIEGILM